jgi:hypothetical protein
MTDSEALNLVVARTGHRRYRELLDPAHPDHNPAYWPIVRALATAPPVEPLTPLHREALRCPFRGRPIVGCGCFRCLAGGGEPGTARVDVVACLLCQRARLRALPSPNQR